MATAAATAAAAMPTSTKDSGGMYKFHAIRKCDSLNAPAIFLDNDDCSFYIDQNENEESVEYKAFDAITEAVEYILETIRPTGTKQSASSKPTQAPAAALQYPLILPRPNPLFVPPVAAPPLNPVLVPATAPPRVAPRPMAPLLPRPAGVPPSVTVANILPPAPPPPAAAPFNTQPAQNVLVTRPPASKTNTTPTNRKTSQFQTEKQKEKFKAQVALLQQHREKHGTFDVLVGGDQVDNKLKRFAKEMRRNVLNDRLTPDQYERLEAIGFIDDVKEHGEENSFDCKARRLQEYHTEHGNFDVTDSKKYPRLRGFVQTMVTEIRKYIVNRKKSTLTEERFQKLESIGLVDEAKGTANFEERLKELKDYQAQHGHLGVDIKDSEAYPELASFTKRMRREIRKFQKKTPGHALTPEQYQQLESIGLVKQVAKHDDPSLKTKEKRERKWEEMFQLVKQFKNGNGRLPQKSLGDDPKLYNWVQTQKQQLSMAAKKGVDIKLSAQQVARLTALGVHSNVSFKSFEERVQEWIDYKQQNGGKNPPGSSDLGYWSRRTKQKYKEWKLGKKSVVTQEVVDKLSAAGFQWPTEEEVESFRTRQPPPKRSTWEERFQDLVEYKRLYGHTQVPQQAGTPGTWLRQLGSWVHDQRGEYKKFKRGQKSSMNPERLGKLMEIGFFLFGSRSERHKQSRIAPT